MKEFTRAKLIIDETEKRGVINEDQEYGINTLKSNLFNVMGFPEKALQYKLNCVHIKRNYQTVVDVARLYLKLDKTDSAIYYFKLQLQIADSLEETILKIRGNNNIGFGFFILKDLDSAIFYYQKAIDLYTKHDFKKELGYPLYATINGNLGQIAFIKKEYDKAIEYLLIDFEFNLNSKQYENSIILGKTLCKSYYKTGKFKEIRDILEKLSNYKYTISRQSFLMLSNLKIKYYNYLKNPMPLDEIIQINTDSLNLYVQFLKREIKEVSIINAKFQSKQNNLELSIEITELKAEKQSAIEDERYNRIKIIFLSSISVLIIALGIIWYQFRKKQYQNEELILKNEKIELNHELINKKSDLTDLAIHITRNKEFNTEILDLLAHLKNANKENYKNQITNISNFIKQQLNNVETINIEFFKKLELKHPGLTKNEKEICGLIRLNLSNKEIANIKNISVQSSRTARYRLKKKMDVSTETDLPDYLKTF